MQNGFRGYHPYVVFMYYVYVSVLLMVYDHPLFLLTALVLLIFVHVTHDYARSLKRWAIPLIVMGMLFIILNPLLVSRGSNVLFTLGNRPVTLEATVFGVVMSLTLVTMVILCISFNLILNGNKFLFVFSKVLPRSAFLTMLTIRFVPLLKGRYDEIASVQRMRGMTVRDGTVRERARNGMNMIQTLLRWSLEEAIQTADSMEARGYGSRNRSSYETYIIEMRDWIWLIALFILFLINIVGSLCGYGQMDMYPTLGTWQLQSMDWVLFGSFVLVTSFPLVVEGIEYVQWKFFN